MLLSSVLIALAVTPCSERSREQPTTSECRRNLPIPRKSIFFTLPQLTLKIKTWHLFLNCWLRHTRYKAENNRLLPNDDVISRYQTNLFSLPLFLFFLGTMLPFSVWIVLTVCSANWPREAGGAKILAIPQPYFSHVAESNAVAKELIKRGHEVILYLPDDLDSSRCAPDVPSIRYGERFAEKMYLILDRVTQLASEGKIWTVSVMRAARNAFCDQFSNDSEGLEKLRQKEFDFALIDFVFFADCNFIVPYNLSIPFASIGSVMSFQYAGHFVPTSVSPFLTVPYSPKMLFSERVINTLAHVLAVVGFDYYLDHYDYSKIAPGLTPQELRNLPKRSELFIENADDIFGFPKPRMPNVVQVGGLTVKPAKPLPSDIQKYFNSATHGVIIVSFGSIFKRSPYIEKTFLSVFKKLKQKIIWKTNEEKRIGNVLISKWLPQNDALAHNNTKLLIYHCGNNGMFESLYHGVPLICIPQAGDQFQNSRKLEYLNIGRFLDVAELSEELLLEAIEDILNNPIYTSNIKHLSEIYRSRPELPAERAASAIEHVMKYGGKHLRLNQVDLSPFQLLAVDVWFTIFMLLFLFIKLLLYFFTLCKTLVRSKSKIKQN